MNERDKAFARESLEKKLLTIEQVEAIRAEADRTGKSFSEAAAALGHKIAAPSPVRPLWNEFLKSVRLSPLYLGLLAASFLIFAGLLIASLFKLQERSRRDEELVLETVRSNKEAHRQSAEARRGYTMGVLSEKEAQAREQLAKARAAMARVETILQSGSLPTELTVHLNDAFVGFNAYLSEFKDDALVCVERARTHELRRNYDLAIADLEHAISVKPELEPGMKSRIAQLRLLVARKPQ